MTHPSAVVLPVMVLLAGADPPAASVPTFVVRDAPSGPLATFTAKDGAHSVVFTVKDAPASEEGSGRILEVVHEVTAPGAKRPTRVWQAKDFVLACPFDVTLELLRDTVRATDLDGDGTPEISFAYVLSCRSDVSPDDMKLLLYEGSTKYALRGTRATFTGAVDDAGLPVPLGGGPPAVDPAWQTAPPAFLAWATAAWDAAQPTSPR